MPKSKLGKLTEENEKLKFELEFLQGKINGIRQELHREKEAHNETKDELAAANHRINAIEVEVANGICHKLSMDSQALSDCKSPILWLKTPGHGLLNSASFCRIRDAIRRYSPGIGFVMLTGPEMRCDTYTDEELARRGMIRITGKNPGFENEDDFLEHCKKMYAIRKPMGLNICIKSYEDERDPDGILDKEKITDEK